MTVAAGTEHLLPWYKEPTKDQWLAWVAAWLGWTLDAFDFTIFLLIMVPISKEFGVPLVDVLAVFTVTLWLRLVGATASGWLADRVGRKIPLMISILWYSICNFIAGFSPSFMFLFIFRALLGIGMGAEWPAGAALAMESWPARSRGLMSGMLQGSWGLGFLLASVVYGVFYEDIGWRGCLWIGILPAFVVLYIRKFVKEPEVWRQNRAKQEQQRRQFRLPLLEIFRPKMLPNTLTACLWMGSSFVTYYTCFGLFATHLQKDLGFGPGAVALPNALSNLAIFASSCLWGTMADRIGRRWAMIIPALIGILVTPFYLGFFTKDYTILVIAFTIQGFFVGSIYGQNPSYLNERFPTEVRATAAGFCYHQGAIWGGLCAPLLGMWAANQPLGFALPMLITTVAALVVFALALLLGPETRGQVMASDITLTDPLQAGADD
ncbi:MAG: MFS transporter [Alphaproteobacteria bacterium]|nr:MFS transporter [Alphaproteobacteria bacterium]